MTRSELLAGLRRMGLIFVVVLVLTIVCLVALGLLAGSSVRRSVSVGLYLVAVGCIVLGLFQGIKPPVRPLRERGRGGAAVAGRRHARRARRRADPLGDGRGARRVARDRRLPAGNGSRY